MGVTKNLVRLLPTARWIIGTKWYLSNFTQIGFTLKGILTMM